MVEHLLCRVGALNADSRTCGHMKGGLAWLKCGWWVWSRELNKMPHQTSSQINDFRIFWGRRSLLGSLVEKDWFKKLAKSFLATTHSLRREKKNQNLYLLFSPLTLEPEEQINKLIFFFIRDPLTNVNQIFFHTVVNLNLLRKGK